MDVLGLLAVSAAANNGMRTLLFVLVLVAVVLLLAGASIALFTLLSMRKTDAAPLASLQTESENI